MRFLLYRIVLSFKAQGWQHDIGRFATWGGARVEPTWYVDHGDLFGPRCE